MFALVSDPACQEPEYGTANHRVFETRVPVQDCLTVDVHSRWKKYLLQGEFPRLQDVYCSRGCFRDGPRSFLSRGILDRRQWFDSLCVIVIWLLSMRRILRCLIFFVYLVVLGELEFQIVMSATLKESFRRGTSCWLLYPSRLWVNEEIPWSQLGFPWLGKYDCREVLLSVSKTEL